MKDSELWMDFFLLLLWSCFWFGLWKLSIHLFFFPSHIFLFLRVQLNLISDLFYFKFQSNVKVYIFVGKTDSIFVKFNQWCRTNDPRIKNRPPEGGMSIRSLLPPSVRREAPQEKVSDQMMKSRMRREWSAGWYEEVKKRSRIRMKS